MQNSKIELLAPAGDRDAFLAAVAAGANAVYFGLEHFSARTRAKNITIEQAKTLLPLAKSYGVKTYLTLNTLLLQSEIEQAVKLAATAAQFGLDAVIVQDLGLFYALKQALPHLEYHASTQMTSHNLEQCRFLADLGFSQINLSRELSLEELKPLCDYLHGRGIVPEVFVHGAFCISFSGQCYFSGTLYGEAGNRGSCVQPCRRCYKTAENFADSAAFYASAGENNGISFNKKTAGGDILPFYLKDNNAFALADRLAELAPISLKIEGRIKNAEYVWSLCSAWRQQLDNLGSKPLMKKHPAIEGAINRGYSDDYLRGSINSQMFATGEKDLSLVNAGSVESFFAREHLLTVKPGTAKSGFLLAAGARILIKEKNGDFVANALIEKIESSHDGRTAENRSVKAKIKIEGKLAKKIGATQQVFANTSVISPQKLAQIIAAVESKSISGTFTGENSLSYINVTLSGRLGEPLKGIFKCSFGESIQFTGDVLQAANGTGLNAHTAGEKLGKLGGTGFALGQINCDNLQNGLYVSPSSLNAMRRAAIEELAAMRQRAETAEKEKNVNSHQQNEVNTQNLQNGAQSQAQIQIKTEKMPVLQTNLQLPKNPQLAFVCSTIDSARQLLAQNYCAILEIPLTFSAQIEEFAVNSPVVPYFGAVLIGEHLENARRLVKALAHKKQNLAETAESLQNLPDAICANMGLAQFAAGLGLNCLLDSNLNIVNGCSSALLAQKNIFGFIPSLEIAPEEIEKIKTGAGENVQLWYPLFYNNLLMQSRQCLVKKASNCTKSTCDAACLANCNKSAALLGVQGEELVVKKRPGFYSALYQQGITYNGDNFAVTGGFINRYLVDLRFVPLSGNFLPCKIAQNCEKLLGLLKEEKTCQQKNGRKNETSAILKELQNALGKIQKPKYFFSPCGEEK